MQVFIRISRFARTVGSTNLIWVLALDLCPKYTSLTRSTFPSWHHNDRYDITSYRYNGSQTMKGNSLYRCVIDLEIHFVILLHVTRGTKGQARIDLIREDANLIWKRIMTFVRVRAGKCPPALSLSLSPSLSHPESATCPFHKNLFTLPPCYLSLQIWFKHTRSLLLLLFLLHPYTNLFFPWYPFNTFKFNFLIHLFSHWVHTNNMIMWINIISGLL